jgi:phosphoribosylpyrophosphate synthetase
MAMTAEHWAHGDSFSVVGPDAEGVKHAVAAAHGLPMQIWLILDKARWAENNLAVTSSDPRPRRGEAEPATDAEILLLWMWLRTRPFAERLDRQYYIPLDRWWQFTELFGRVLMAKDVSSDGPRS